MFSKIFLLLLFIGQAAPPKARTVWDGVYTSSQATRGQAAYRESCSRCHELDLSGRGGVLPLAGRSFIDRWREDDLVDLFTYIKVSMPKDGVETVNEATKSDILAYVLHENGFPPGTDELKPEMLGMIQLVGKEGPKPLPSLTIVRAVGCLQQGADKAWTLSNAPEPNRARLPDETTPEELMSSTSKPLGPLLFKLPGLDFAIPGVKPDPFKGHKVQVKGAMYRQPNNDRINVRSLKSLTATCGGGL